MRSGISQSATQESLVSQEHHKHDHQMLGEIVEEVQQPNVVEASENSNRLTAGASGVRGICSATLTTTPLILDQTNLQEPALKGSKRPGTLAVDFMETDGALQNVCYLLKGISVNESTRFHWGCCNTD